MARRSLHIGVNAPDRSHYGSRFKPLKAAISDASALADLLKTSFDFPTPRTLFGPEATADRVLSEIKGFAEISRPGDIFALTFSGHGDQGEEDGHSGDDDHEPDNHDEAWALHDRLLLDDEVGAALLDFIDRGKVVLLTDSCHSRTVAWLQAPGSEFGGFRIASLPLIETSSRHRALAAGAGRHLLAQYPEIYNFPIEAARRKRASQPNRPWLVSLAACLDCELAAEDDTSGHFTGAILDLCRDGFQGSYEDLVRQARARIASLGQTPSLYWYTGSLPMLGEQIFS